MTSRRLNPVSAVTLVEVMVCITIIAILVAIIGSVVSRSKFEAKIAVDISNLRQLGHSVELYVSDDSGLAPKTMDAVISQGLVPVPLVSGSTDPTVIGYANIFRDTSSGRMSGLKPTSFKMSYLSRMDAERGQSSETATESARRKGWLIAASHGKHLDRSSFFPEFWHGGYLRLCNDGSVVKRQFRWRWITPSPGQPQVYAVSVTDAYEDRD